MTSPTHITDAERQRRIALDFTLTATEMLEILHESIPDVTPEDVERWRCEGLLQSQVIGGEMRFFRRDPANLFRRSPEACARRSTPLPPRPRHPGQRFDLADHVHEIISLDGTSDSGLCCPTRHRMVHTLTVVSDAVPANEIIRCWLPIPRMEPHQTDFILISTDPEEHVLAPGDQAQRSVYLERPAMAGEPTVFRIEYEYTAWASHKQIDPASIQPHDESSDLFRRFTAEEPPHIVFTPRIRAFASELVGNESNPYLRAKRIFDWIDRNVVWVGEREYSTIDCFPELCIERGAGDCGVQAMTFITLCRAVGIPARWESGLWTEPSTRNLHDWARFHVEPHGWLWADLTKSAHPDFNRSELAREFYFGNIDAFRMVANSAVSQPFEPPKSHTRSETIDFQRGEVEWDGGNLYFDQWGWELGVEVLRKS